MPISITSAALGGEIAIPTLDGSAKIRVPAETQTGKTFRFKAKGWLDKVKEFFDG